MRVKSNKALRRSARLAQRASPAVVLPAATLFPRRPMLRIGAANTIAAAVAGILYGSSGTAYAQATPEAAPASAQASQSLEEVVVTASATGVKKLDASYNIISADDELIKESNPKSAADILKLSPGIWPESSGGLTGANIEVAGFPSGGDAPFFTQMIEGLPLFGMPNLSFMDSTSFVRLDDTVERLEVVQGGPAAVFGPGQMGATANYILRTGTAEPAGSVGLTYGNEGLWRTDDFYAFKVADGWYGSVGGFYVKDDGVRPPQFPSDIGGQLTATLKHDLDDGSLLFWGRVLDEKDQFIVPVPLIQSASGTSFSNYPGFCALTCSYGSKAIENVSVANPAGGFENADLANGRGGQLYFFGIKWEQKLGDWQLLNNFIADGGGLDTNALFSGPNPRPLSYYLYGCNVGQAAGYCNSSGTPVDTNNLSITLNPIGSGTVANPTIMYSANVNTPTFTKNKAGQVIGITYPTSMLAINATYAGSGLAVPLNQSMIQQGWWFIQKSLQNLADEFRVSREIFPGDTLTGGVYLAAYTDNDNWSLGNQMLMTNTPNATPINLNYVSGGQLYNVTSSQGFVSNSGNFDILEHGDAMNIAPYLSDSWKLGPWLFDAGARVEHLDAHQRTCNRTAVQMGSAYDLWDNDTPLCNGTFDYEHYVRTRPTYTVGANYEFASNMSAYARINDGVHYNDFDNGIRDASTATPPGFAPLETVQNYEVGFKYQVPIAYLDISAYKRTFNGLSYQEATSTGTPLGIYATYGADTKGIDFTATLTPLPGLNFRLVGDYMDGHYQNEVGNSCFTNIFGAMQCVSVDGAPLQRQPKFQVRFTPSYTYPASWGDATAWVTYEYIGQRYEDIFGQQPLGAYNMLSAGILTDIGKNWQFRIQGTNLNNEIALTEGNARISGKASGIGGVLLARPIEGRELNFTAYYKF
jgi:outer membrane cobalamin receptor